MNICWHVRHVRHVRVREHMFEQCLSRTYVRGQSIVAELHELGCRLPFEHSSVETYETVEQTQVQMGLELEFAALEFFKSCNCRTTEKSTTPPSQWRRMSHSMFEACSHHVRAVFVNGFWQCCNFIVWECCDWAEEDCVLDWVLPLWQGAESLQFVCVWPKRQ